MVEGRNIFSWPSRISQKNIRVSATILGDPLSKQRPRLNLNKNGHVYTPRHTQEAEENIRWAIRESHRALLVDGESNFGVRLFFYSATRQRRDLDNMSKLLFDACTGLVWADDSQVRELIATVERLQSNPRTVVLIYTLPSDFNPNIHCKQCGKLFKSFRSWNKRRYCSKQCAAISFRRGREKHCYTCKKPFYVSPSSRKDGEPYFCSAPCRYKQSTLELQCLICHVPFFKPQSLGNVGVQTCSEVCRREYWHQRAKARRVYKKGGVCISCGASTSKTKYQRCAPCLRQGVSSRTG